MPMNYRLVAIDFDGTLLTPESRISEDTLQALCQVHEHGAVLMFCTGRTLHKAEEVTQGIPFEFLLALHNGAVIVRVPQKEVLVQHSLSSEQAEIALSFLQNHEFHPTVYTLAGEEYRLYYEPFSVNEGTERFLRTKQSILYPCDDITISLDHGPIHIVAADQPARIQSALAELQDHLPQATLLASGGFYGGEYWFLEILSGNASKSQAIQTIADQHGIEREEVLAIGDNYNDLDMLTYAGLGIAMANAPEEIRARADAITESNGDDGVAKALNRYILRPGE